MPIITLTSDMGLRDYYVAAVKAAIYSQFDTAQVVDISHDITPFDTTQAAFVVRNCFREFPKGTVHILGVNPDMSDSTPHVIVSYEGHFFIGADNGIFSLIFDRKPDSVFELNITQDSDELTFPTKNLFVKAACHLARGGTAEVVGRRTDGVQQVSDFRPVIEEHVIKGTVIYIDSYGNVITNITRSLFKEVGRGRDFAIMFKRASLDIRKISDHYNDVPEGERVALFSAAGFLEIAINKGAPGNGGGANTLFGLKLKDIVRIEFNANQGR